MSDSSHSALDRKFDQVVRSAAERVRSLGFKRNGRTMRLLHHGNSAIIEFQRSTKSSKNQILFTINLAIVCGELLDPGEPPAERAHASQGHLRERIGALLPCSQDTWWTISETTDIDGLANEIAEIVSGVGAPYLQRYIKTNDLIKLWRSGVSPGLTKAQCLVFLERVRGSPSAAKL